MKRALSQAVLVAVLAGALTGPGTAAADQAGQRLGDREGPPTAAGSSVPSRVTSRLRRASAALRRAEERIDDGDGARAVAQFGAVRRALSSASKSGLRHVAAGDDPGPGTASALLGVEHDVAAAITGDYDGQGGDIVDALTATLKNALDARDAAIAAIAELPDGDQSDHADTLDSTSAELSDELDAIEGALSDDTLSADAKNALNDALTQVTATQKRVDARVEALGQEDDGDGYDGPCHDGPAGPPWRGM